MSFGVHGFVEKLPPGFTHAVALVGRRGIAAAQMGWGEVVRQSAGTARLSLDDDPLNAKLIYLTDAGGRPRFCPLGSPQLLGAAAWCCCLVLPPMPPPPPPSMPPMPSTLLPLPLVVEVRSYCSVETTGAVVTGSRYCYCYTRDNVTMHDRIKALKACKCGTCLQPRILEQGVSRKSAARLQTTIRSGCTSTCTISTAAFGTPRRWTAPAKAGGG